MNTQWRWRNAIETVINVVKYGQMDLKIWHGGRSLAIYKTMKTLHHFKWLCAFATCSLFIFIFSIPLCSVFHISSGPHELLPSTLMPSHVLALYGDTTIAQNTHFLTLAQPENRFINIAIKTHFKHRRWMYNRLITETNIHDNAFMENYGGGFNVFRHS